MNMVCAQVRRAAFKRYCRQRYQEQAMGAGTEGSDTSDNENEGCSSPGSAADSQGDAESLDQATTKFVDDQLGAALIF